MKQPTYTSAPIAGDLEPRNPLKTLFIGHRRSTRYYEARDAENTFYLLWMEYSRFGTLLAYPCVLAEKDAEPLFFDTSSNPMAEENNARLLARWEELSPADRRDTLEIRSLAEKEFRTTFRKYRAGNVSED